MQVSQLILAQIEERKRHFYRELEKATDSESWFWLQGALAGVDDCLYFIEKIMEENK